MESKDDQRFLKVLKKFRGAVQEKKIEHSGIIRGFLGEVSVSVGITDKNLVLTPETKQELTQEVAAFKDLRTAA